MTYEIKDRGDWVRYDPGPDFTYTMPDGTKIAFPPNTMFCKRVSDDVDWYTYSRNPANFIDGSVKVSCIVANGFLAVAASSTREILLFPQAQRLIEVSGYTGNDPLEDFKGCIVDVVAGTITMAVRPP